MTDESQEPTATEPSEPSEPFEGFSEGLATGMLTQFLDRVDTSSKVERVEAAPPAAVTAASEAEMVEAAPPTTMAAASDVSQVEITLTGKVKLVFWTTVTVTIRGNGRLTAKAGLLKKSEQLPSFLIPDGMTPAHADVGKQKSPEALKEAMLAKGIELLVQGWEEVGWQELLRALESFHLPLWLAGLEHIPAIPVQPLRMIPTLARLVIRLEQKSQATKGLNNSYTIGGRTAYAYDFLFGSSDQNLESGATRDPDSGRVQDEASLEARNVLKQLVTNFEKTSIDKNVSQFLSSLHEPLEPAVSPEIDSLTQLPLDDPEQWSMSWTTWPPIYQQSLPLLDRFAATLTDADEASRQFWPNLADYGLAYNLTMLNRVDSGNSRRLQRILGDAWNRELETALADGRLYVIDLSIFETIEPQEASGEVRFTPATITLLELDPESKWLLPVLIRVAGSRGKGAQVYTRRNATDSAWLYALQAAKVSITVYGIWLGHVYQWHIVTAAMQMTMFANIPENHAIYQLLAPQFRYLIPFDDVLLLGWKAVAPPTSIASGWKLLELCNTFADGRDFFEDDPSELARRGVEESDFTVDAPWDRYAIVGRYHQIWKATSDYVTTFVDTTYKDDREVAGDSKLQDWIADSSDPYVGNIRGLPAMKSRAALTRVLTSLLYRIEVHGASRLSPVANPGLTFVANYPPCLQDASIPEPSCRFDTRKLLELMPRTGTIGGMVNFYFTFAFSPPYESFIPISGIESSLFFQGGLEDPRNRALVDYRRTMIELMKEIEGTEFPQIFQWPMNIET